MKFKDFLTKLKADGKITQPEFLTAIETAPEWEFPDKAVEAFESTFLTLDRATTDKSVHTKIKREVLDSVDRDLHELVDFNLKDYVQFQDKRLDAFRKENNTHEKVKILAALLDDGFKRVKVPATDDDTKKKLKEKEDAVSELMARIEKMNNEYSVKEKSFQTDYDKKISEYKLINELEKLANGFKFGKAYTDETIRKDITKGKLDLLRATNKLEYVEKDGQPTIQVLNEEGKPRFMENSNTPVTVNKLLEDAFKIYIKANNTGDDDDDSSSQSSQETKRFRPSDDKNTKHRQGTRTTVS